MKDSLSILMIIPNFKNGIKNHEIFFPLGIPYVVSIIEQAGYEVDVLNLNFYDGDGRGEIIAGLKGKHYDIVGTGGIISNLEAIRIILSAVKAFDRSITTIVGGRIMFFDTELVFSGLDADWGVIGDADSTLHALLRKIATGSGETVSNTIQRVGNGVVKNPLEFSKGRLIDTLPYPDILKCGYANVSEDKVIGSPPAAYAYYIDREWKSYSVASSFNCVNNCTFCGNDNRMYRRRSLHSIVCEMEYAIGNFDSDLFNFTTEIFSAHWSDVEELCLHIARLKEKYSKEIYFTIPMRIKGFSEEKAAVLKRAGCVTVFFGFESYDDGVLASMRKGITSADIDTTVKACKNTGLFFRGYFIFGDTEETRESYIRTLNYWREHCRGFVNLTPIVALPGTQIMERCVDQGIITDKWEHYKRLSTIPNYFQLSRNISRHMNEREHRKMLNMIITYLIRYQLYSRGKTGGRLSAGSDMREVSFRCGNCSAMNEREEAWPRFRPISSLSCSGCGAANYVYTPPSFIMMPLVKSAAFFSQYFGMRVLSIWLFVKSKM